MNKNKNKKSESAVRNLLCGLFWILVWEAVSLIIPEKMLLPSPFNVAIRLFELVHESYYYVSVLTSIIRILSGYILGVIAGVLLGFAGFFIKTVNTLFSPLMTTVRSTPVASFIILALIWIGRDFVPSFTAFLMVMPIIYTGVTRALSSSDFSLFEVTKIFKLGFVKRLLYFYAPSAIPGLISSSKTALGLAWKAGIAAEVLCSLKNSIGGEIYSSKLYLEFTDLFAWTVTVIILSLLLEKLISFSTLSIYQKYTIGEVSKDADKN